MCGHITDNFYSYDCIDYVYGRILVVKPCVVLFFFYLCEFGEYYTLTEGS